MSFDALFAATEAMVEALQDEASRGRALEDLEGWLSDASLEGGAHVMLRAVVGQSLASLDSAAALKILLWPVPGEGDDPERRDAGYLCEVYAARLEMQVHGAVAEALERLERVLARALAAGSVVAGLAELELVQVHAATGDLLSTVERARDLWQRMVDHGSADIAAAAAYFCGVAMQRLGHARDALPVLEAGVMALGEVSGLNAAERQSAAVDLVTLEIDLNREAAVVALECGDIDKAQHYGERLAAMETPMGAAEEGRRDLALHLVRALVADAADAGDADAVLSAALEVALSWEEASAEVARGHVVPLLMLKARRAEGARAQCAVLREVYGRVGATEADGVAVALLLARSLMGLGERAEAKEILDGMAPAALGAEQRAEWSRLMGMWAVHAGDEIGGVEWLQQAVALDSHQNNYRALLGDHLRLAAVHRRCGRLALAAQHLQDAQRCGGLGGIEDHALLIEAANQALLGDAAAQSEALQLLRGCSDAMIPAGYLVSHALVLAMLEKGLSSVEEAPKLLRRALAQVEGDGLHQRALALLDCLQGLGVSLDDDELARLSRLREVFQDRLETLWDDPKWL